MLSKNQTVKDCIDGLTIKRYVVRFCRTISIMSDAFYVVQICRTILKTLKYMIQHLYRLL